MKCRCIMLLLLIQSASLFGQDTIKVKNGSPIVARIVEVGDQSVKYKKFSNLNGPDYLIGKDKIAAIVYKNGETESFGGPVVKAINPLDNPAIKAKTKRNSKVLVIGDNGNALIHATKALNEWGYWQVVDNKKDADFILEINMKYAVLREVFAYALFKDVATGEVFYRTNDVSSGVSIDFNFKRVAMNKLIKDEIRPTFSR